MNPTPPSDRLVDEVCAFLPSGGAASRTGIDAAAMLLRGPDAGSFLQRIASQDLLALAPFHCAPTAFLSGKGRLQAEATVVRVEDGYLLETAASAVAGLAALCERYHFSEQLTIEVMSGARIDELVALDLAPHLDLAPGRARRESDGSLLFVTRRGGLSRAHRVGDARADRRGFPAPTLDPELAEALRIAAGEPRLGVDTDERTLALEAGLDDHVSTTKGCYVGQEIVARIQTYGHVNRRLVRLRIASTANIVVGTPLLDRELDEPVGRVMSSVRVPATDWSVALGWLPEAFLKEPAALRLGDAALAAAEVQFAGLAPA